MGAATRRFLGIPDADPVLTFVGRCSYPPNKMAVEYIKNVLSPAVWEKYPKARFLMVSRDMPADYLEKADPRFIPISDGKDYPYINAANLCLAPLAVGGGTRIKILNYFACGKPVVSTAIGIEGIPAIPDRQVVVATLGNFTDTVNHCLEDPTNMEEIGVRAREFAELNCSWENSIAMFESVHEELVRKNGA